MDTSATDLLLTTTRTVRNRLDLERPVEPDVILAYLRIAVQAPTGGNKQSRRWIVVTDPDRKSTLARIYRAAGLKRFQHARDHARDEQTRRAYEGALYLAEILERVPVLVVPCQVGRVDGQDNSQLSSWFASIFPAVWSFQLALRSRGLGTALTTEHLKREAEVAAALGVPDNVTQVAHLPVAYTSGTDFRPARRKPVEDVTFVDRWNNRWADSSWASGSSV